MTQLDGVARVGTAESVGHAAWRPRYLGISMTAVLVGLGLAAAGVPVAAAIIVIAGVFAHATLAAAQLATTPSLQLPPAPESEEIVAPDLREQYKRIAAKSGLLRSMLPPNGELARRCSDLVRHAGLAAQRANLLYAYLESDVRATLETQASALERRATLVADATAASAFTNAAVAKLEQLDTRGEIQGMFDRTVGKLSLIEASFDATRAKLIKLEAIASEDAAAAAGDIRDHLEALDTDLRLLEEAVTGDLLLP